MSIFGSILHKIFTAAGAAMTGEAQPAPIGAATVPAAADSAAPAAVPAGLTIDAPTQAQPAQPAQPVDVEAVLTKLASGKGGGGNWRSSIVDLLKLLDLDSSLDARKQLAGELNVHAAADGTAEQNIALHHAVMQKLAENGGTVPASLKG